MTQGKVAAFGFMLLALMVAAIDLRISMTEIDENGYGIGIKEGVSQFLATFSFCFFVLSQLYLLLSMAASFVAGFRMKNFA